MNSHGGAGGNDGPGTKSLESRSPGFDVVTTNVAVKSLQQSSAEPGKNRRDRHDISPKSINDPGRNSDIFEDDLSFLYLTTNEYSSCAASLDSSTKTLSPNAVSRQTMPNFSVVSSYQNEYPLSRTELVDAISPKIDLSELRELILHTRRDVPELSNKIQAFIVRFLEILNQKISEKKYLEFMIEKRIENYDNEIYQFYEETEKQIMLEREKMFKEFETKEMRQKLEVQNMVRIKEYEIEMLLKKSLELEEKVKEMNSSEIETVQTNKKLREEKNILALQLEESQKIQEILNRHLARIQENLSKPNLSIKNESSLSIVANISAEKDYLTQQLELLKEYNRKLLDDKDELEARNLSSSRYSPSFSTRPLHKHGSVLADYFGNDLTSGSSLNNSHSCFERGDGFGATAPCQGVATLPGNQTTPRPVRRAPFGSSSYFSDAFKFINSSPYLDQKFDISPPKRGSGDPAYGPASASNRLRTHHQSRQFVPAALRHSPKKYQKFVDRPRADSSPSLLKLAQRPLLSRFRSLAPITDVRGIGATSTPTLLDTTDHPSSDPDNTETRFLGDPSPSPTPKTTNTHGCDVRCVSGCGHVFSTMNLADHLYAQQILTRIQSRKRAQAGDGIIGSDDRTLRLRRTRSYVEQDGLDTKNSRESRSHLSVSIRRAVSGSDLVSPAINKLFSENAPAQNDILPDLERATKGRMRSYAYIADIMDPLKMPSNLPSPNYCRASPLGASISSDSGLSLKKEESLEELCPRSPVLKATPKLSLKQLGIAQNLLVRKSHGLTSPKRVFKVILVGDLGVGKSTFIHMACHRQFCDSFVPTLGMDFQMKSIDVNGQLVALQIWDTAGQEKFRALTRHYYRKADAILLMYDISYPKSFENLKLWINEIGKNLKCFTNDPNCCSVLYRTSGVDDVESMILEQNIQKPVLSILANKMDLIDSPLVTLSPKDILLLNRSRNLANDLDTLHFEVSSKTGRNIEAAFQQITKMLCSNEDMFLNTPRLSAIRLESLNSLTKSKRGKCGSCYKT